MKDIEQYGLLRDDEWEFLPWLPSPRPSFDIWVKSEDIAPFFFVQHHPFALSLLLRISDSFKMDIFNKLGLEGSSKDWEILTKGIIKILIAACSDEKSMHNYLDIGFKENE